jgi:hypothetical protein
VAGFLALVAGLACGAYATAHYQIRRPDVAAPIIKACEDRRAALIPEGKKPRTRACYVETETILLRFIVSFFGGEW